jgi:hypothetical protein
VQHGTLRSELDEPAVLPAAFADLAARISWLQSEYESGRLTRSAFADALDTAKVGHTDGSLWTVGVSSGQWYRKIPGGRGWEAALPPDGDITTRSQAAAVADEAAPVVPQWMEQSVPLPAVSGPDVVNGDGGAGTPWPEVTGAASTTALPSVKSYGFDDLIDDDGVWTSTWDAAVGTAEQNPAAPHAVWGDIPTHTGDAPTADDTPTAASPGETTGDRRAAKPEAGSSDADPGWEIPPEFLA